MDDNFDYLNDERPLSVPVTNNENNENIKNRPQTANNIVNIDDEFNDINTFMNKYNDIQKLIDEIKQEETIKQLINKILNIDSYKDEYIYNQILIDLCRDININTKILAYALTICTMINNECDKIYEMLTNEYLIDLNNIITKISMIKDNNKNENLHIIFYILIVLILEKNINEYKPLCIQFINRLGGIFKNNKYTSVFHVLYHKVLDSGYEYKDNILGVIYQSISLINIIYYFTIDFTNIHYLTDPHDVNNILHFNCDNNECMFNNFSMQNIWIQIIFGSILLKRIYSNNIIEQLTVNYANIEKYTELLDINRFGYGYLDNNNFDVINENNNKYLDLLDYQRLLNNAYNSRLLNLLCVLYSQNNDNNMHLIYSLGFISILFSVNGYMYADITSKIITSMDDLNYCRITDLTNVVPNYENDYENLIDYFNDNNNIVIFRINNKSLTTTDTTHVIIDNAHTNNYNAYEYQIIEYIPDNCFVYYDLSKKFNGNITNLVSVKYTYVDGNGEQIVKGGNISNFALPIPIYSEIQSRKQFGGEKLYTPEGHLVSTEADSPDAKIYTTDGYIKPSDKDPSKEKQYTPEGHLIVQGKPPVKSNVKTDKFNDTLTKWFGSAFIANLITMGLAVIVVSIICMGLYQIYKNMTYKDIGFKQITDNSNAARTYGSMNMAIPQNIM